MTRRNVGAIVQATGFTTYDIAKLPELGGGTAPTWSIRPDWKLWRRRPTAAPIKRADGKASQQRGVRPVRRPARRGNGATHLPYCSGHCCATSVKQAMYFKDANPDIDTVVMYTDLRVPGMGEDFYRSAQKKGVTFTKGKVTSVLADGDGCQVKFRDLILDEDATIVAADLVVLATGQVPNAGVISTWTTIVTAAEGGAEAASRRSGAANDLRPQPELPPGSGPAAAEARLHRLALHLLPLRDAPHRHLRRRPGAPADGHAAGDRGRHRRRAEGDPGGGERRARPRRASARRATCRIPIVRLEGCTQCKRCTVECPFGAIDEDEKRYPGVQRKPLPPLRHLHGRLPGARDLVRELLGATPWAAQIKAVDMPDEFSEKPRILILACENDAYPALDMAGIAAHRLLAPSCARSRCAASARSTPSGSPTRSTPATTA